MKITMAKWYNYKELCTIAKYVKQQYHVKITGTSLQDIGTNGKCGGGYGSNVYSKIKSII